MSVYDYLGIGNKQATTNWSYNCCYFDHNWWDFVSSGWDWNNHNRSLIFSRNFFGLVFIIIGAILSAVGIGYLVVSYGLLKGKRWSWTITSNRILEKHQELLLRPSILVIFNLSIKLLLPKTRYRCSLQNDDNGNDNGLLYYILVKIAIDNPILIFAIITLC